MVCSVHLFLLSRGSLHRDSPEPLALTRVTLIITTLKCMLLILWRQWIGGPVHWILSPLHAPTQLPCLPKAAVVRSEGMC